MAVTNEITNNLARGLFKILQKEVENMQGPFKREITQEQYRKATEEHDSTGIFSYSEICGYGVYSTRYFEEDGKYYVSFELGSSCD